MAASNSGAYNINGGAGDDILTGGSGNDVFTVAATTEADGDTINGGAGMILSTFQQVPIH